jgi:hypothetical protein
MLSAHTTATDLLERAQRVPWKLLNKFEERLPVVPSSVSLENRQMPCVLDPGVTFTNTLLDDVRYIGCLHYKCLIEQRRNNCLELRTDPA